MNRRLASLGLVLVALPLAFVIAAALEPGGAADLTHLVRTVLPGYLATTALVATAAAGAAMALGGGAAFAVTFLDFPGRRGLEAALVLPLALPSYLLAIVYRELSHLAPGGPSAESTGGLVMVLVLALYPYVYLLARAAFRRQGADLMDAGRALGVGGPALARRVLLPLARPALLLGGLLVVLETVGDFGTADVLGVATLTTTVHRVWFASFDALLALRLSLLTALIPLALLVLYGLAVGRRSYHATANRPRRPARTALTGPARWLVPGLCALPVLLGFAVPVLALVRWAVQALPRMDLAGLGGDILNSLLLAAAATALGLAGGLWFAAAGRLGGRLGGARQGQGRWSVAAMGLVSLNFALPAMVLAFAALTLAGWMDGVPALHHAAEWLSGSTALLLGAVALRYMVFAHLGAEVGFRAIPPRLDDTVRCHGGGPRRVLARVLLPLSGGALAVGGLLVFVNALKDLTLSLVLQPFGYGALSIATYHLAKVDAFQAGSVYALCLVAVALYPVWSIHRWFDAR
ncbi:MAG: iron ABC transporter permease [Rhodobacterales bacterium]|nr:iron ABC transporter permease [Rhodobacterales bacterium]